jgi:mRNA interferase MazF
VKRATENGEIWEARMDKSRPVVVVSRDDLRGVRSRATVAPITTSLRDAPTFVLLDHRDGLPHLCAINCDEVNTLEKSQLARRLGRLSETKLAQLHGALRFALQLGD